MRGTPTTLVALTDQRPDPAAPLVTYYDQATGERVELSGTTTANWVAKTSNFLVDELDASPGTRLRLGLPTHWLRMVWLLSAWNVGAAVVADAADIGVTGPDLIADEPVRLAASLRPLGARFSSPLPSPFVDLGAEIPGHGDHFTGFDPPTPDTMALDLGAPRTHADVLATAVPDSARLLIEPGETARDAELLVNACLGGGSLVVVAAATPDDVGRIADQEGATCR